MSLPLLLLASPTLAQQPLPADRQDGAAAVTVADTRAWLGQLASEEFGGRGTGEPGFQLAADYVRDHFAALGLEPGAGDGWFQDLPWAHSKPDIGNASLRFARSSGQEVVIPGARLGGSVADTLRCDGEVVVLVRPTEESVGEAELEGRVVVLLLGGGEADRRGAGREVFSALRLMQGKGAAALLFVAHGDVEEPLRERSGPTGGNRAARGRGMLPNRIDLGRADYQALLRLCGRDTDLPAGAHRLDVRAHIDVPVEQTPAPACNVVGVLRGSDPARRDEYVVIGSHLDHLGRSGDRFFPGADDDGSGTTGVMAAAQMFAKNGTRPARSVLFVCFCGEERGLLGSRHFADNPPIPIESIVAELQMDMIGRDEEEARDGRRLVNKGETAADNRNSLHVVGTTRLAPSLHELCLAANTRAGFDLEDDHEDMFGRSDHANFARLGVPVAFFFTGLHRDYHQESDTPDKIHYEKLLRVATYVYDIGFSLAQAEDRPHVDPELWREYRGKGRREPAAPLLGEGDGR
ncbi:MAG: M20/M25/M40 family metallo-hydrolase [Planctomycetota bacterium]